jgi:hypothetical protein
MAQVRLLRHGEEDMGMKKWFILFTLIVWSFPVCPIMIHAAENWTGNVNAAVGIKYFDNVVWDSAGQLETGIDIDFRHKSWPVNVAVGISGAAELDVTTTEMRLGVRKIFEATPRMRPFIGGGLDYVSAERDEFFSFSPEDNDSDTGLGGWISCGIYWTFADWFNAGFELQYSYVPVTLSDGTGNEETANVGGIHLLFLIGYHM